jgi:light-regulated signal transduction histidine kinase (bacteriophytochrome)
MQSDPIFCPFSSARGLQSLAAFSAGLASSMEVSLDEMVRSERLFSFLLQITEALSDCVKVDEVCETACNLTHLLAPYSRVMIYRFDREDWHGKVIHEVTTLGTPKLYLGLQFPASDIPRQTRDLYVLNRTRQIVDRFSMVARLIQHKESVQDAPFDMSHCFLRAGEKKAQWLGRTL